MLLLSFLLIFSSLLSICRASGLYTTNEEITLLNSDEFKKVFAIPKKDYLVEFFHSYCGHCISYAPHFKRFAATIREWKPLLEVVVLDCASEINTKLCSEINIEGFPTLKYYPKDNSGLVSGHKLPSDISQLANLLVDLVSTHSTSPYFKPIEEDVWKKDLPKTFILLKGLKTKAAVRTILDFTSTASIPILWSREQTPYPSIHLMKRAQTLFSYNLTSALGDMRDIFKRQLLAWNVWKEMPHLIASVEIPPETTPANWNTSRVHYNDLHSTLTRIFYHEVPMKWENGAADKLSALKEFLNVLIKYFHGSTSTKVSLEYIRDSIFEKSALLKQEYEDIVKASKFPPLNSVWATCLGSEPYFRRYPCGLWTLFHSLTVAEYEDKAAVRSTVLPAMKHFILNFFSCRECAKNFAKESARMEKQISDPRSAVLWLWRTHNRVNLRLKGAASEDPAHPKIQFPSRNHCSACRLSDNGPMIEWNEDSALSYLVKRYSSTGWEYDAKVMQGIEQYALRNQFNILTGDGTGHSSSTGFAYSDILLCAFISLLCTWVLGSTFCCMYRRSRLRRYGVAGKPRILV